MLPATSGIGIAIDLVNVLNGSGRQAIVSAIEIWTVNTNAIVNPTVRLDLSTDNGLSWSTLAASVPLGRYGQATFDWTVPSPLWGPRKLAYTVPLRTTSCRSMVNLRKPFRSLALGDRSISTIILSRATSFSTASGDDANLGTTPDSPMETLSAILAAYTPTAGDVVYVDSGDCFAGQEYRPDCPEDAHLCIQGPATGDYSIAIILATAVTASS